MPVARKLWQLTVDGSPAALARRLTIWKTICLFIRVPFKRDPEKRPAPLRSNQPMDIVCGHVGKSVK